MKDTTISKEKVIARLKHLRLLKFELLELLRMKLPNTTVQSDIQEALRSYENMENALIRVLGQVNTEEQNND